MKKTMFLILAAVLVAISYMPLFLGGYVYNESMIWHRSKPCPGSTSKWMWSKVMPSIMSNCLPIRPGDLYFEVSIPKEIFYPFILK